MTVYIFGNGNLSFENFAEYYLPVLDELSVNKKTHYIICDFRGADTLSMEFLKTKTPNVSIYHIGNFPRYMPDKYRTKVNQWGTVPNFTNDSDRDQSAQEKCTHFLAKDFNSSNNKISSTLNNIQQCLSKGKIDLLSK